MCWNKPFKGHLQELYEDWMAVGPKTFTSGGNMRAPTPELLLDWVYAAFQKLSDDLIKDSFKVRHECGMCALAVVFSVSW